MPFQTTIGNDIASYIPGEIAFDSPQRVSTAILSSEDAANNVAGRAFFRNADETVRAGGTGVFAGILINGRTQVSHGTADFSLGVNNSIRNGVSAEFMEMGIPAVLLKSAGGVIGDGIQYNTTTGELDVLKSGGTPAAGYAELPNAKIDRHNCLTAVPAGQPGVVAIIKLTTL